MGYPYSIIGSPQSEPDPDESPAPQPGFLFVRPLLFYLSAPNNAGSVAMLLAIRLASSEVSILAMWHIAAREFLLLLHGRRHQVQNQGHRMSGIDVHRPYLCRRHHRHCSLDKF
jgi:hypothetical protein